MLQPLKHPCPRTKGGVKAYNNDPINNKNKTITGPITTWAAHTVWPALNFLIYPSYPRHTNVTQHALMAERGCDAYKHMYTLCYFLLCRGEVIVLPLVSFLGMRLQPAA